VCVCVNVCGRACAFDALEGCVCGEMHAWWCVVAGASLNLCVCVRRHTVGDEAALVTELDVVSLGVLGEAPASVCVCVCVSRVYKSVCVVCALEK
jgi:hypothetical protein